MMTYSKSTKRSAEKTVRDIRRATRRNYSAEEKIRWLGFCGRMRELRRVLLGLCIFCLERRVLWSLY
jgi:hypothetical protein